MCSSNRETEPRRFQLEPWRLRNAEQSTSRPVDRAFGPGGRTPPWIQTSPLDSGVFWEHRMSSKKSWFSVRSSVTAVTISQLSRLPAAPVNGAASNERERKRTHTSFTDLNKGMLNLSTNNKQQKAGCCRYEFPPDDCNGCSSKKKATSSKGHRYERRARTLRTEHSYYCSKKASFMEFWNLPFRQPEPPRFASPTAGASPVRSR